MRLRAPGGVPHGAQDRGADSDGSLRLPKLYLLDPSGPAVDLDLRHDGAGNQRRGGIVRPNSVVVLVVVVAVVAVVVVPAVAAGPKGAHVPTVVGRLDLGFLGDPAGKVASGNGPHDEDAGGGVEGCDRAESVGPVLVVHAVTVPVARAAVVGDVVLVLVGLAVAVEVLVPVQDAVAVGVSAADLQPQLVLVLIGDVVAVDVIVVRGTGLDRVVFVLVGHAVMVEVLIAVSLVVAVGVSAVDPGAGTRLIAVVLAVVVGVLVAGVGLELVFPQVIEPVAVGVGLGVRARMRIQPVHVLPPVRHAVAVGVRGPGGGRRAGECGDRDEGQCGRDGGAVRPVSTGSGHGFS